MFTAAALSFCARVFRESYASVGLWPTLAFAVLELVLFAGSRDTLWLCCPAHKRSYVAKMVMWPCGDSGPGIPHSMIHFPLAG